MPCVLPLTNSYNVNVCLKANFILFDNVSSWSCSVSSEYPRQRKVSSNNKALPSGFRLTSRAFSYWDGGGGAALKPGED